ncbi:MAG TPA: hypothetical protein VM513_21575, partial [Kofleriaceae bacterium]|nr:hypothetical protein [Kofleriaceae bacterium]
CWLAASDALASSRQPTLELLVPEAGNLLGIQVGKSVLVEGALKCAGEVRALVGGEPKGLFEDRSGLGAHASRIAQESAVEIFEPIVPGSGRT